VNVVDNLSTLQEYNNGVFDIIYGEAEEYVISIISNASLVAAVIYI
jgi:hypothetical protein